MENAEEIEKIAELETLISIDMYLAEIVTLLQWLFVSSFAVIGLILILIFFVGKGDKG